MENVNEILIYQTPVDKCQAAIFFLPNDFLYILPIFTARSTDAGHRGVKAGWNGRLFLLLHFMKHANHYKEIENTADVASFAIWKKIDTDAYILLDIIEEMLGNLFPNDEERAFFSTLCVPAVLQGLGIIGSVEVQ